MIIKRELLTGVQEAAGEFPVVAIVGPRQSGKTTLAQMAFPEYAYVSLEDYDIRAFAQKDPRAFLEKYGNGSGVILDEIRHAPELLSYMQTIVDREKKNGFFIVTGSQNFLVDEAITQTLAGRMAVMTLLPLSISELKAASLLPEKIEDLVFQGSYPKVHAQKVSAERLYTNYIRLYVERDVRQIKKVEDLTLFQKFMRLCAGRIGQLVNFESLGNDCGIDQSTVRRWLSLLEASYVIVLLYPYYKNFGKRVMKSPKLYFFDTGIACSLLNIRSPKEFVSHYLRGGLIESFLISDFFKQQYNLEQRPSLYFWRDKTGNEIDLIFDAVNYPIPIEIKAGKTIAKDFFKGLEYWEKTTKMKDVPRYLVYAGSENQKRTQAEVVSWQMAGGLVKKITKG